MTVFPRPAVAQSSEERGGGGAPRHDLNEGTEMTATEVTSRTPALNLAFIQKHTDSPPPSLIFIYIYVRAPCTYTLISINPREATGQDQHHCIWLPP